MKRTEQIDKTTQLPDTSQICEVSGTPHQNPDYHWMKNWIFGARVKEVIKNFLLELFFPSLCLGCRKEGTYLCQDCKAILEISQYHYCLCNKNPLRFPLENQRGKCNRCKDKKLSGLYSALSYKERFLTRKLIYQFKYQPYIKELAKVLTNILVEHFILTKNNSEELWQNSCLVPVPLDKKKLKNRGYNQAEELAKELAKTTSTPALTDILIKIKTTTPQIKLSKEEREKNLKGAFAIKKPAEIAGKKIFLVDDVYTTGSTMEECAKVLKTAGAKHIWGIVVAREG